MIRDNSQRATQAVWFFVLTAVAAGLNMLLGLLDAANPQSVYATAEDELNLLGLGVFSFAILYLLIRIASYVFLIRWFRRAYANIARAGEPTQYSDGWAAGAWFVPIVSFFRPYSMMKEVWRHTQLLAYDAVQTHGLLRAWWLMFVLHLGAAQVSSRADAAPGSSAYTNLLVLEYSLSIAMAVLTVVVIRRVATAEAVLQIRTKVSNLGEPAPSVVVAEDAYTPTLQQ
ncbi:DUF4328 domain-containing protein [Solirubrum puertoriconensis]|uniref:DUF4328 domain-containing protein n=1 Tax=Solirubrum puertoriconensis TaxID=1751427 RepID=A0A9X0HK30_SOLP1|nr:DUF4328 domain-containing protein [Solirubrum puertoriconensis]KUG07393.1 hypothetical protein ASU33_13645 [Solirubrum puertoriconensis]